MKILTPDYRDMITCFQSEGVEFMLVGGYAVDACYLPTNLHESSQMISDDSCRLVGKKLLAFRGEAPGGRMDSMRMDRARLAIRAA